MTDEAKTNEAPEAQPQQIQQPLPDLFYQSLEIEAQTQVPVLWKEVARTTQGMKEFLGRVCDEQQGKIEELEGKVKELLAELAKTGKGTVPALKEVEKG